MFKKKSFIKTLSIIWLAFEPFQCLLIIPSISQFNCVVLNDTICRPPTARVPHSCLMFNRSVRVDARIGPDGTRLKQLFEPGLKSLLYIPAVKPLQTNTWKMLLSTTVHGKRKSWTRFAQRLHEQLNSPPHSYGQFLLPSVPLQGDPGFGDRFFLHNLDTVWYTKNINNNNKQTRGNWHHESVLMCRYFRSCRLWW